jgi:hypothetical protein
MSGFWCGLENINDRTKSSLSISGLYTLRQYNWCTTHNTMVVIQLIYAYKGDFCLHKNVYTILVFYYFCTVVPTVVPNAFCISCKTWVWTGPSSFLSYLSFQAFTGPLLTFSVTCQHPHELVRGSPSTPSSTTSEAWPPGTLSLLLAFHWFLLSLTKERMMAIDRTFLENQSDP